MIKKEGKNKVLKIYQGQMDYYQAATDGVNAFMKMDETAYSSVMNSLWLGTVSPAYATAFLQGTLAAVCDRYPDVERDM